MSFDGDRRWTVKEELEWLETIGWVNEETRKMSTVDLLKGYLAALPKRAMPAEFVAARGELASKAFALLVVAEKNLGKSA